MSHDQYNEMTKCPHCGYMNPPTDLKELDADRCDSCWRIMFIFSESPCDFSNDPAILVDEVKVDSIEEAAKEYSKHLSRPLTIDYAFIAGAKSEASKQYWKNYFKHN